MKVQNYETLEGAKACWIFEDQAAIILTSARQGAGHGADAQIKKLIIQLIKKLLKFENQVGFVLSQSSSGVLPHNTSV